MNQSGYADLLNQSIIDSDTLIIGNLNLPNLDKNSVPFIDANNNLSDILLNNGQLIIGKTGLAPSASTLTGTTNEIIITNGSGSITLSTPQQIATTSSPTFNNITITGNVAGNTNSRSADDILSCSTSQTTGDLLSFSSAQKVVVDSGVIASNVVTNSGTSTNNDIVVFNGTTGKLITDSGINISAISGGPFMPIAGGTFSGNVGMASNVLTVNNMSDDGINGIIWGKSSTNTAGAGGIVIGNNSSVSATQATVLGASSSGAGTACAVFGPDNTASSAANGSVIIGNSNNVTGSMGICVGYFNTVSASNAIAIGQDITNSTANSMLIGSVVPGLVNFRPATNGTCDLGATASNYFNNAYLAGNLAGTTNSRTVNSIVAGPSSAVSGNLASFNGTSGVVVQDSGIVSANVITDSSNLVSSNLVSATGNKTVGDSAIAVANVVTNTGGTVTSGNVVTFSGTSGRVIQDSGKALSAYLPLAGGTMSGNIAMGNNSVTGLAGLTPNGASVDDVGTSGSPFKTCWLKYGQPAKSTAFQMYGSVTVSNTTSVTSVTTGSSVGSLVYTATQSVGMGFRFRVYYQAAIAGAGDTLSFNFRLNGSTILSTGALTGAFTVATGIIEAYFVWTSSSTMSGYTINTFAGTSHMSSTLTISGLNNAATNTWNVAVTFSAANVGDSVTVSIIELESTYST